jgi:hypothetical protein
MCSPYCAHKLMHVTIVDMDESLVTGSECVVKSVVDDYVNLCDCWCGL